MQRKVIGQGVLFLFAGLSLVWNGSADEPPPTPTVETGPIGIQIVGGQPASTGEYPWMAALVSSTVANPQQGQFCGGSLVTPQWVVTAAHCVTGESASTIDVVVGINNLSSGPTTGSTGQRRKVSQIIVHPAYNSATDDSDIALLRLGSAVTTNSTVSPITPLGPGTTWADPGDMATVTGWGATSSGGASSNALLEVDLPIVSNTTCNNAVGGITANMLCAGYAAGGKDSCQGDSGGR
jgi:secreted trypsin-like serine protease